MIKKFYLSLIVGVTVLLIGNGCTSIKTLVFPSPVDTSTKTIIKPTRKIFKIPHIELYASNDFDGANLNDVKLINDSTITVFFQPENRPINDSPYYSFKLWSNQAQSVHVLFNYPDENKHRYNPKVKKGHAFWQPLDSTLYSRIDNTILLRIPVDKDTIWLSAQEVISSKDTQKWIQNITSNKPFIHIESAGKTLMQRNIPVLDIFLDNAEGKEIIVLLTRQHPPEVTGYMAFQEFLSSLTTNTGLSHEFLKRFRIIAFPILNPDGVDLGHWRHNSGGIDLNRDWSQYRQPEIKQAVKYLSKQLKKDHGKIILGMDFHSTWYDVFYTNKTRSITTMPNFLDQWFVALENNIPNYIVNEISNDSERPVSKAWFLMAHNAVGITYEIGDETPRDRIKEISSISAIEMMKILVEKE